VVERLRDAGLRAELDTRDEKVGYKIRQAELQKVPYMLVVGSREMEQGTVSLRSKKQGDEGASGLEDFIARALDEVARKH
jgi:threonyl-tRNA synthetase